MERYLELLKKEKILSKNKRLKWENFKNYKKILYHSCFVRYLKKN
jgi:hypothetical protein